MYRCHSLSVGVKGLFECTGILILQAFMVDAERLRHIDQRPLCRVADDFALAVRVKTCIVTERCGVDQFSVYLRMLMGGRVNRRGFPGFKITVDRNMGYSHFVQGECAGFVGTDNGGAAQGFYGGQLTDQCVFLCHTLYAQSHYDGSGCGQSLWNNGDGQ